MTPTLVLPGLFVPGVSVYPLEGQAMVPCPDHRMTHNFDGYYCRKCDQGEDPPRERGEVPFGSGPITLASWCPECEGRGWAGLDADEIDNAWGGDPEPCSGWVCRSANAEQVPMVRSLGGPSDRLPRLCDCRDDGRGVRLMRPNVYPSEQVGVPADFVCKDGGYALLLSDVSDELHAYPTPDKTGWVT